MHKKRDVSCKIDELLLISGLKEMSLALLMDAVYEVKFKRHVEGKNLNLS